MHNSREPEELTGAGDATARRLVEELTARGETIATCESLTAGAVAARIADIPGASSVLKAGLVTYSTDMKTTLARVPAEVISKYGVVSAECARSMAAGSQQVCSTDWAVSLTGVAGPGASDGHPAGDVFIAFVGPQGQQQCELFRWPEPDFDRAKVRHCAVEKALFMIVTALG